MTKQSRRGRYRTVCVKNVEVLFGRGVGVCRPQIRLFAGSVQSGTDAASSSHAREQEDLRIDRQRTRVPTRPGAREQFHPPPRRRTLVFGKLAALAAVFTLLVVPVARASTTDTATAAASDGPYFVDTPITFTSTTPCTTACRLIWKYLSGTRLGEQMGEGESVQRSFSTPGWKTVQLRMTEFCVGTTRLVCDSVAYVSLFVEDVATPLDTTPPTISVSGVEVEATGPLTAVEYAVAATDPEAGAVPASCTPSIGSQFPLGETPIDCTATDPAGNVAMATFSVVVKDTTPPDVHTPTR